MSSHKIHADWMAERSVMHTDEHGVPLRPEWTNECEAKKHATLPTQVHPEEDIVINAEEQDTFTQHEYLLQNTSKYEERVQGVL